MYDDIISRLDFESCNSVCVALVEIVRLGVAVKRSQGFHFGNVYRS